MVYTILLSKNIYPTSNESKINDYIIYKFKEELDMIYGMACALYELFPESMIYKYCIIYDNNNFYSLYEYFKMSDEFEYYKVNLSDRLDEYKDFYMITVKGKNKYQIRFDNDLFVQGFYFIMKRYDMKIFDFVIETNYKKLELFK